MGIGCEEMAYHNDDKHTRTGDGRGGQDRGAETSPAGRL
jgi:hypothetical protein